MRKIKIESEGTGASTRVTDADTGEKLSFSKSVVIRIDPGLGPIKAMVAMFELEPEEAGKRRRVKVRRPPKGVEGEAELVMTEEECLVVEMTLKSKNGG